MAYAEPLLTDEEKVAIADIKIAHVDLKAALQSAARLGMSVEIDVRHIHAIGSKIPLVISSVRITRSRTVTDIDIQF